MEKMTDMTAFMIDRINKNKKFWLEYKHKNISNPDIHEAIISDIIIDIGREYGSVTKNVSDLPLVCMMETILNVAVQQIVDWPTIATHIYNLNKDDADVDNDASYYAEQFDTKEQAEKELLVWEGILDRAKEVLESLKKVTTESGFDDGPLFPDSVAQFEKDIKENESEFRKYITACEHLFSFVYKGDYKGDSNGK